ncbi:hydroxymethylglutaryl-CoA lyase [Allosaccharopolyspora coralli]|uniref:Hydroxymethylglutaryl-CoA lyase n=1 Tax=Allosaccharopolyspora coralli TaxID=2665642 RepID=A0A5Q3Q7F4_9PSEU|nr:hydroxymethylglutaryl-CoA lyase [Allosaccharopolyspora coralli]QGK70548.1 hydroxymethylglutaryl-CoA lyase [Allosaccharopolyspora coralli]
MSTEFFSYAGTVEVGPRDGLQNEATLLATETKVEFIERAVAAGVRRVEATAFVHPDRVPQMADAEAVMSKVPRRDDVSYIGLVLNARGFERARDAGVDEVNAVTVATDTFGRRNQGTTVEEGVAVCGDIVARAHQAGLPASVTVAAAFGCPFEGEVGPRRVAELARRIADSGPAEIAVADTIGVGVPSQVTDLLGRLREATGDLPLRCHFHNTRNTGYANAVAALQAGVSWLDASIGGIGGCPFAPGATGNIATEDLEYLLAGTGVRTGLDLARLAETGRWIGERLGSDVPAQLGRVDAFPRRTEA